MYINCALGEGCCTIDYSVQIVNNISLYPTDGGESGSSCLVLNTEVVGTPRLVEVSPHTCTYTLSTAHCHSGNISFSNTL